VAAVLAAPLAPLVGVLVKRGWSTFRAALVVTVTTVVVVVGIVVLAAASLVPQGQQVVATAGEGARQADSSGVLADSVGGVGSAILSSVGIAIAGIAVVILLSAVLCFYLLRDGASLWRSIVARLPARTREPLTGIAGDSVSILSRYMIGTGAISAFGAASQFLTMALLGLPLALPLAVLSFFGGFIPYIGSFITTGLAFLVTVATGSPFDILVMLIFTLVFNIVTGNVVAPIVYSRAVNLHPAVVLLAIPAGNAIAGILGMFLAVPAVAIVTTTWRPLVQLAGTMPPAIRTPAPSSRSRRRQRPRTLAWTSGAGEVSSIASQAGDRARRRHDDFARGRSARRRDRPGDSRANRPLVRAGGRICRPGLLGPVHHCPGRASRFAAGRGFGRPALVRHGP
jgi:predicted PurR-regulated permease PerM